MEKMNNNFEISKCFDGSYSVWEWLGFTPKIYHFKTLEEATNFINNKKGE